MPSDFTNIKDSGSQCAGCGRSSKEVMLMRLRTYSRSLCCASCFLKHATCENENILGVKCHHEPTEHFQKTGPCSMDKCGCQRWIHGLENEHDRQYADSVGKMPTQKYCRGFANRQCSNILLAGKNGAFPVLCTSCMKLWVQGTQETMDEAAKFIEIDEKTATPQ